ncbi:MAG: aminopeptidase P family protein [Acidobacteria bacterium]|nr:aminopeptidase P family protein [Acidobacteriota bacterium]
MSTHSEQKSRLARLREDMAPLELDAAIVSSLVNIRYLTGFSGSNALLLVTHTEATLLTDPRYTIQAKAETAETGIKAVIAKGSLEEALTPRLSKLRRIGFENNRVSYRTWEHLQRNLPLNAGLRPLGGVIEQRRMVKSAGEIAAIRESVRINSQAFAAALTRFRAGMSETDFAAEIEHQMRLLGAEKPSFDTIVAFRERSALPHASPGCTRLDGNGLLLVDMGTFRGGYASDMTRCIHLGKPGAKTRSLYRAVLEAQLAGLDAVAPGASAEDIDSATRRVLRKHGLAKAFIHSAGHGLGLEIHEAPRLGRGEKTILRAGMAITVEPGAYIEGAGGVRIEDTVLVTANGVEVLTPTSKELVIL